MARPDVDSNMSSNTLSDATFSTILNFSNETCQLTFQMELDGVLRVLCLMMITLGLISNTLSGLVFANKMSRTSTTVCLFAVSVSDGLTCFFLIPYAMDIYAYTGILAGVYKFAQRIQRFSLPAVFLMKILSIYLLCLLSVERLMAITIPMKFSKWFSARRMKIYVVLLFAFVAILTIPDVLLKTTTAISDPCLKDIRYVNVFSSHSRLYYAGILPVFGFGIPLLATIACSIGLVVLMKMQQRRIRTSVRNIDKRLSKLVLAVVVVSLVCFLPTMVLPGIAGVVESVSTRHALVTSIHFFNLLNSSINIFVYLLLGSRFRKSLVLLFRGSGWEVRRNLGSSSTSDSAQSTSLGPLKRRLSHRLSGVKK